MLPWIVVIAITTAAIALTGQIDWLAKFPTELTIPIDQWINLFMGWFIASFKWLFRSINWVLAWPMDVAQALLQWLPWPATTTLFCVIAYIASSWRLAVFTAFAMFYMVITGYWLPSMNTLGMVLVSIPLAIGVGFGMAVAAYKSRRINAIIQPTLDLMQTVPTFAYLIPILLLFGFGPVVGVVASAIYACPPMARNMILGLQKVPPEVLEAGLMSGSTRRQQFWWVRVPSALPNIMIGVNQTTMAALSMVIIAAIIGSSADIGWEVLSTMRKAQFGQSLLAGIVIALIAMVLDRVSWGFTDRTRAVERRHLSASERWKPWLIAFGLASGFVVLSFFVPLIRTYPEALIFYPADPINDALSYVTANHAAVTDAIKKSFLFYYLLPIKVGLTKAISPFSWGFSLTPWIIGAYAFAVALFSIWLFVRMSWKSAVAVVVGGGLLYFGITSVPWLSVILVVTLLAYQVGGRRTALLSLFGCLFMLFTGVWGEAMTSVYMCLAAVVACLLVGGATGIWACQNNRVSNFIRPINDTLQTMPLFVILIPFLMFFQIGEFTSFLAIVAYAIVPVIRYTEHGLRNVPTEVVEAAQAMGCTRRQLLWEVKMPLAIPEIMLGLNQTVMFALAMLVITALVGSRGLGQSVYIALSAADAGKGIVAGLGMALIAIIADRIIQSWSKTRKEALGLS
uniref:ABC-type proline/glycine betaine transport system, permease component n=2 Tax=Bacteria TaxID=2 RepID=E7C409_9GAMM|nr:ABC-type proline/glycine betaine transport system, permease component [uncultured gamma proteobacterium HF0200_34B07]ADI22304.1 ABC-type proline/glycine betaine transport system, permease component [uncultured actinobacterium HF0200_46I24]